MKPILLELQAFGPYIEKQTIDFDRLYSKGIFLINGDTGSGKTTIFDAMMIALYGGCSGESESSKGGRNDIEQWRCTQAGDDIETYVKFIFSANNKTYYFKRSVVKKIKNNHTSYECGEIKDGVEIPFFSNAKAQDLNKKAVELIGLTKEQFRQVVLLPQGQFERFLLASSEEKEQILSKIFSTEIWKTYANKFFEKVDNKKKELDKISEEIAIKLQAENVANLDELKDTIIKLQEEIANLVKEHNDFNSLDKSNKLDNDIKVSTQFNELSKLVANKARLDGLVKEIEEKKKLHEEALSIEIIKPKLDEYESELIKLKDRKNKLEEVENLPEIIKDKIDKLVLEKTKLESSFNKDEITGEITRLKLKEGIYTDIDKERQNVKFAQDKVNKVQIIRDSIFNQHEQLKQDAASKLKEKEILDNELSIARNTYYSGIYGNIASELKDNTPCPICGSLSHPNPAKIISGNVTKEEVDKLEKKAKALEESWKEVEKQRENKSEELVKIEEELAKAKEEKVSIETKLNSIESNLESNINSLTELYSKIKSKQQLVSDFESKLEEITKEELSSQKELSASYQKITSAKEELEKEQKLVEEIKTQLDEIISKSKYSDINEAKVIIAKNIDKNKLFKEITEYNKEVETNTKDLETKKTELKGIVEPDSSKFADRRNEIINELEEYNKRSGELSNKLTSLDKLYKDLEEKEKEYQSQIIQVEEDLTFAKHLRGDTGVGIHRYILGIMFDQVIAEANIMLKNVHDGRYTLYRTLEKVNGNKRGLDLKVHDIRCNEQEGRNVDSLSGGEKFLVSLSLSIGMSTIAQQSGVQIEALFIDEGFGTLDYSSIDDAMKVLACVQRSSGLIGIISHVEILERNIPTHINVIKTSEGSKILAI